MRKCVLRFALLLLLAAGLTRAGETDPQAASSASDQAAIQEAASWIVDTGTPQAEYQYVMTCRVRLLLFWAGKDDVGGGFVRIGEVGGKEHRQVVQVLFGSDPSKAPMSINRWGAGTEVLRDAGSPHAASAFFGFMKSSKGQSPLAMRSELSKEKAEGNHLFEGIISRVDDRALSTTVPYVTDRDFDLHQYPEAEKATLQQLENNPSRRIRRLDPASRQVCPSSKQFLSTTLDLISDALSGHATPDSVCYIYNTHHHHVALTNVHPVAERNIHVALHGNAGSLDRTYHNLQQAHFEVSCEETGSKSSFEILLGTDGSRRGVPVQITYSPNWWFQVILNLTSAPPAAGNPVAANE